MFKLYTQKSSVLKRNTRYTQGGVSELAPKKIKWWERNVFEYKSSDRKFILTSEYAGKPTLVSKKFFGRDDLDWLILQYNHIVDVVEEFVAGKEILIPDTGRVVTQILGGKLPHNVNITV